MPRRSDFSRYVVRPRARIGVAVVAHTISAGTPTSSTLPINISGGSGITSLTAEINDGGGWATDATLATNATSHTYSGLTASTSYDVRLNVNSGAAYSNVLTMTTAAAGGGAFTPEAGYSVSGTFDDGESFTVTGSGFGTKPNGAKPFLYLPHGADLNPDASFSRGSAADLYHSGCSFTAGTYPNNGTGSLRVLMNDANNSPGWHLPDVSALYTFSHRKFDHDWVGDSIETNAKFWRIWADYDNAGGGSTNHDIYSSYGQYNTTPDVIDPRTVVENVTDGAGGDNADYWNLSGSAETVLKAAIGNTDWHTFEQEYQASSVAGTADGIVVSWTNGARTYVADALTTADGTHTKNTMDRLFFMQISNNAEPSLYYYYGSTLIDDSRCRIIVSDEASWNTSQTVTAERDFCLPTAWADESITFTVRQGTHASLAGKYLYVIRSDGAALKIGRMAP